MDPDKLHPFDEYSSCDLYLWVCRKTVKHAPGPSQWILGWARFIGLHLRQWFVRVAALVGSDTFLRIMSSLPVFMAIWFEGLVYFGAIRMGTDKKDVEQNQCPCPWISPSPTPSKEPEPTFGFLHLCLRVLGSMVVGSVLLNSIIHGVAYLYYRCCNWYFYKIVMLLKEKVVGKKVQEWVFSNFLMNLSVLLVAGHHAHIIICFGAFSIGLAATICLVHGRKDDMGVLDGLVTCFYICSLTFISGDPHRVLVTVVSVFVLLFLLICTTGPWHEAESTDDDEENQKRPSHKDPKLEWKKYKEVGMSGRYLVRGFPNMGNTCFLNSVMHALLSIDPLRGHFINLKPCDGSVTNALKNLVTGTSLPRSDHLTSLEDLFRCIVAVDPTFKGNQHQDSHEFLRRLIAELSREEDMNWRKSGKTDKFRNSSDPPPGQVERMFTGQLSDVVSCGTCSRFRRKDSLFSDLLLEIPNRKGAQVSLDDCLNQFTRHELLTRDNSWDCGGECGKVKVLRDSKRMEIHTGPRILTIMLKRYTKVEPAGKFIKLENRVTFAERLQLPVNPYPRPAGKVEYCLIGVVCHMGSMDLGKGHYAVYFRGDRKGQSENDFAWYLASDAEVTEVSLEKVLSCDADDAHAYMLFYGNSCEFGSAIPIDSSVYRPSYPSAFDVLAGLCRYRLRSDPGLGDYRFPRMNV